METRNVAIPCPDCGGTMLCWCSQRQHDSDLAATRAEVVRLQGEVRRLELVEGELRYVLRELQRLQPNGSPPPGGPEQLAEWIVAAVQARQMRAEGEVTALRQFAQAVMQRTKGHVMCDCDLHAEIMRAAVQGGVLAFDHEPTNLLTGPTEAP